MGGARLASILKIPALAVGLTLADAEATLPEVDQSFGMGLSVADGHGALHAVPIRLEGEIDTVLVKERAEDRSVAGR